jgi:LPS-assembly protein
MPRRLALALLLLPLVLPAGSAQAQLRNMLTLGKTTPTNTKQPVTFTANQVQYDQKNNLVIASGKVEAWQGGHVLQADKVVYDRTTSTMAASGHVVLMEPDGEVMFAHYVELSNDMNDAILKDMGARLAQNGKLVANGARRYAGKINQLSRVVYSACNLCKKDPTRPPLWQITANSAVQDLQHKRDEFYDATLEMFGWPVAWTPYISAPDPSVKRASGLLMPSIGNTSYLGAFIAQPYYLVLDDQSDATITPIISTKQYPQLSGEYRRRFNDGYLLAQGSAGKFQGSMQGLIATKGQFDYNDQWRWGFDINRASSTDYVRDFRFNNGYNLAPNLLTSTIYAEGFGEGAYARLDANTYQSLTNTIIASKLPVVLPHFQYSYFGRPDLWGGRLSLDTSLFNVMRSDGTNTRQADVVANWQRSLVGSLGDLWSFTLHGIAVAYNASDLQQQPNFSPYDSVDTARALPEAAVKFRWPFMRYAGAWGTQMIEPIVQLIVAPQVGDSQNVRYPNEDSMDVEFTDANLFSFNRLGGVDRLEGGPRLSAALHGTWYLGGTTFDGFIGQSYRDGKDNAFPEYTGLHDPVSDIVGHVMFSPASWLDAMYRFRFDHRTFATRMSDVTLSAGVPRFRLTAGYLYTTYDPYTLFDTAQPPTPSTNPAFFQPRDEITLNASSTWGRYHVGAFVRRDLTHHDMVAIGGDASYQDECFTVDLRFFRRYTSINGDNGNTVLLLQFTFKTIGQFGYNVL